MLYLKILIALLHERLCERLYSKAFPKEPQGAPPGQTPRPTEPGGRVARAHCAANPPNLSKQDFAEARRVCAPSLCVTGWC